MKKVEIKGKLSLDKMNVARLNQESGAKIKGGEDQAKSNFLCNGSKWISRNDVNCGCCPQW